MNWRSYVLLFYLAFLLICGGGSPLYAAAGGPPEPTARAADTRPAPALTEAEHNAQILLDKYFMGRYRNENFNGTVLIAHNGKAIYKQKFGYSDITAKEPLTENTAFDLASVSKTFTATAILKLDEQGYISIDDPVKLYFEDFPYESVTIRQMLTHRSGLPDYVFMDNTYINDRAHYMSNDDVVKIFSAKKAPLLFSPNSKFEYSNSNYAILAAIIQKVTKTKFQKYIRDSIFTPLGMTHSFVFDFEDTAQKDFAKSHDAYGQKLKDVCFDGAVGDKGVYCTVEDMLKFDNALKTGKILSVDAEEEAYKPRSFEPESFADSDTKNYGYGWRMSKQADGNNIIYHNGWWHGNNNVFARNLRDNTTIIILGNRLNQGNYNTDPIWDILKALKEPDQMAVEP